MSQQAAKEFLAELPAIRHDLPYSPALLTRLFAQTGEGSLTPLLEIAATIEKDQGLTAKVLGVANSAFYGLQAEVSSIVRATAVLGLNEIRAIVLSMGFRALSKSSSLPSDFELESYWRHQYVVGMLARSLAEDAGVDADTLFTAGLLHDLGKLIVALYRPEQWEAMEALAEDQELTASVAEDRYWGVDHAVIGALVLKSWDFPPALTEPVNWHHAPDLADEFQTPATLLALADALVVTVLNEEYEAQEAERERVVEESCELFEFECTELIQRCEEIVQDEEVEHFLSLVT